MDFNVTASLLADKLGLEEKLARPLAEKLNLTANDVLLARDLAEAAGAAPESVAVPLLMLADAVNDGSTCLRLDSDATAAKLAELGISSDELGDAVESIPDSILGTERPLVLEGGGLYFQLHHKAESSLKASLTVLTSASAPPFPSEPEVVKRVLSEVMEATRYSLEPLQVLALASALLNRFQIISGGPGTGKTTIVLAYLRCLLKMGVDLTKVVLTAPTGRAAKRMGESIENGLRRDVMDGDSDAESRALLSVETTTMHKLLRANPARGGFTRNAGNRLRYEVVIVDEASMVDISLMAAFMEALPDDCALLLLGDQFQLPPVNAGAVLADLMPPADSVPTRSAEFVEELAAVMPDPTEKFPNETRREILNRLSDSVVDAAGPMTNRVVVLEVSKRFQKEIAELCGYVKNMDAAKTADYLEPRRFDVSRRIEWDEIEGVRLVSPNCDWSGFLESWTRGNLLRPKGAETYAALVRDAEAALQNDSETSGEERSARFRRLFARIAASRVLCLTHAGKFGITSLNGRISTMVAEDLDETPSCGLFSGMFVMVLENSSRMNLSNGDVGVLLRNRAAGGISAVFEDGDGFSVHPPRLLPAYRPAFAMTVHKSQGSEFDKVLLLLPENPEHRLLTREIVYTGLTRAKKTAVLVSSDKVLEAAVSRMTERFSGLALLETAPIGKRR